MNDVFVLVLLVLGSLVASWAFQAIRARVRRAVQPTYPEPRMAQHSDSNAGLLVLSEARVGAAVWISGNVEIELEPLIAPLSLQPCAGLATHVRDDGSIVAIETRIGDLVLCTAAKERIRVPATAAVHIDRIAVGARRDLLHDSNARRYLDAQNATGFTNDAVACEALLLPGAYVRVYGVLKRAYGGSAPALYRGEAVGWSLHAPPGEELQISAS